MVTVTFFISSELSSICSVAISTDRLPSITAARLKLSVEMPRFRILIVILSDSPGFRVTDVISDASSTPLVSMKTVISMQGMSRYQMTAFTPLTFIIMVRYWEQPGFRYRVSIIF